MTMITRAAGALTAVAVVTVVASVSAVEALAQTPVGEPGTGNVATGQTLYAAVGCDQCHGTNGQGTAAAPRLVDSADPFSEFLSYVRDPVDSMPRQSEEVVSDQGLTDIFAFLQAPPSSRPAQAGELAPPGRSDVGLMLFRKVGCYQCHANEAQGGANGPRIGPDPIPFARFTQYVRNPTGSMPPYSDKVLSVQDLADIYASLQERQRPPAIDMIPLLAP